MIAFHPQGGVGDVEKLDLGPMGRRIRILRARHDLSQKQLADLAGTRQKTIALIERGKQHGFAVAILIGIARALGNVSLDYICFGEPRDFPTGPD